MGLEARPFVGNAAAEPRAPVAEARLDTAERPSRVDAENRPEAIALMAELVEEHGKDGVAAAVEMVAGRSLRSPVRTPEYVRGILRNWRAASDEGPMTVREVPYLGYVAAGPPVLAEEQALGTIRARVPRAAAGPLFALRVSGDSMVGAGIEDGDYVIEDGDYRTSGRWNTASSSAWRCWRWCWGRPEGWRCGWHWSVHAWSAAMVSA